MGRRQRLQDRQLASSSNEHAQIKGIVVYSVANPDIDEIISIRSNGLVATWPLEKEYTQYYIHDNHPLPLEVTMERAEQIEQTQYRVEELEMKMAFQEATIEDLNQQLIRLNDVLSEQQAVLRLLVNKIQTVEPSNMASPEEETPPPHY